MLQFCPRSRWKSYFSTCANRCMWTTKTHTVTLTHCHDGDTLKTHHYINLSTFMSLLCISPNTIYSILMQTCAHAHTHTHHTLTQIHTQLNEFRGGVSPCQSQKESCMLLQIKNNASASLCVKRVWVLWGKNKSAGMFCPPYCVEAYLH